MVWMCYYKALLTAKRPSTSTRSRMWCLNRLTFENSAFLAGGVNHIMIRKRWTAGFSLMRAPHVKEIRYTRCAVRIRAARVRIPWARTGHLSYLWIQVGGKLLLLSRRRHKLQVSVHFADESAGHGYLTRTASLRGQINKHLELSASPMERMQRSQHLVPRCTSCLKSRARVLWPIDSHERLLL